MQPLMISGFVAVGLLAAATILLRSHSPAAGGPVAAADKFQLAAGVNKLPTEEFEDMSLVFSIGAKR